MRTAHRNLTIHLFGVAFVTQDQTIKKPGNSKISFTDLHNKIEAYGTGAFKEGHGDGFQQYSIIFPKQGTGIIIMSNSDNAEGIFKELLEIAIGDSFTPWYWENYIPYNQKKN